MRMVVGLSILGLICWIVMFLSGHDVWHYAGSPDFWRLGGPPNNDLRAFGCAFYFQFILFLGIIAFGIRSELMAGRKEKDA